MTTTKSPAQEVVADIAEAEFTKALAAFQADMPHIGKGQTADTGSYSYSYADLADIGAATLSLLAKQGLAWSAKTMVSPSGFLLLSSLKHVGGWSEVSEWPLPDPTRASAQQVGSAMTYGRRYTFTALTGVTPGGMDDDGQAAGLASRAVDPVVVAKNKVWEQAQRLNLDLDGLRARYAQDNEGQVLEAASADALNAYADKLSREGVNGLPLNKDGSVSIRQSTEEQRVEAGMASKEEQAAHKALVNEVLGDDRKAERSSGIDESDPWANVKVAEPGSAA